MRLKCAPPKVVTFQKQKDLCKGMVWYSSMYIAPLNGRGPTKALLFRLAPRKETSSEK